MEHYTNIKQSKKLLSLGLNLESADMYWAVDANIAVASPYITKTDYETQIPAYKGAIPCWSVGALLEVMPKRIFSEDSVKQYIPTLYIVERAVIGYQAMNEFLCTISGKTLIEAAYNMVVWLLENNYIKKGE